MSITLRYATWSERDLSMRAIHTLWRENHVLSRDAELFHWMYQNRCSLWDQDGYCFALAYNGDDLVGFQGGGAVNFNTFGQTSLGMWRMMWTIIPDASKAKNAGLLLSRALDRPPIHVTMFSGANERALTIQKALGFEIVPELTRHFVVLPTRASDASQFFSIAYPDWDKPRIQAIVDYFKLESAVEPQAYSPELTPDWNTQGWTYLAPKVVGTARDYAFLSWRYRDHPRFHYRFVTIQQDGFSALAVWRIETPTLADGRPTTLKIGRVMEFLYPEPELAHALFLALIADMESQNMACADYYGLHHETAMLLDSFGFKLTHCLPDGKLIPSLFKPLTGGGKPVTAGYKVRGPNVPRPPSSPTAPGDCWLFTKGDCDQDRPN